MGKIAVAVIVSLWVIPISIMVDRIVPEPYMDEIFHIPQAQQYCRGNFKSWDPMITTPPGLYYLSLAHVASLFPGMFFIQEASSFADACSTAILRSINGVLAIFCSVIVYEILVHLRPALDKGKATLYAVILALYPTHWFFAFLYYTDVSSLTAVLATYLACLKKRFWISSLLGALAILIRQTNVIWMLFVACIGAIDFIQTRSLKNNVRTDGTDVSIKKDDELANSRVSATASNLRKRKNANATNTSKHSLSGQASTCSSGLLVELQAILFGLWHLKWEFLVSFSPFFIVLVAFVAFVYWNGGIVLGAKEAHVVSPHFAQIMYFGLVSAFAMAPFHFTMGQASAMCRSFLKNRPLSFLLGLLGLTAGFLSVHFFSIAHPYLLADNRHYTFYLWRKIIKAHWSMKYLLVPCYVYSWFSIFSVLGKIQKKIWLLLFFMVCAAVLIPAPLIEFRYYTIPFYFLIINSQIDGNRRWFLIGILYIAINIFTMMMFLFWPFHWEHEPGTQRFIW